ncbi:Uncharacterised protein (plasmid) [Tsukamurella tyrosinosolvens]|uniref:Zinc-finger n=1 Tax=Tsukamurella tyrosinosolvens TaxID=57704 RepID=A0A1H4VQC1_TSUTY|nr:hypothetical protein AXK58_21050 [Tsukamurella tyrosinosolvens]SEC82778.1 hypothetical protein SAMN04489793_3291 [Tsukamurella tyrosinosolvens]VEH90391.1 Uncharacterised protein [Tsukamurella tyrosinosolvens]
MTEQRWGLTWSGRKHLATAIEIPGGRWGASGRVQAACSAATELYPLDGELPAHLIDLPDAPLCRRCVKAAGAPH